jgi:hypothetical protein
MSRWRVLGALSAASWLWPDLRHAVESNMTLHMLLQFPLLLLAGACAASLSPRGPHRAWARVDAHGLTSAVTVSCVAAYWMIPAALDAALLDPVVNLLKYASWWLGGAALASAWTRMRAGVRLFFLGNAGWMYASAGLMYQEAETRLCVSYLFDQQRWTGWGLVTVACLMGLAAVWSWLRVMPRGEAALP